MNKFFQLIYVLKTIHSFWNIFLQQTPQYRNDSGAEGWEIKIGKQEAAAAITACFTHRSKT